MVKNIFVSNEDNRISNTIAGIAFVVTLGVLYFLIKPADVYTYIINIAVALVIGGIIYVIVELIRQKLSK